MKRFLGIACVLFSGYASAQVVHPEDPNIVGTISSQANYVVCFEYDGNVNPSTCASNPTNTDGIVLIEGGSWKGAGAPAVIRGCGTTAVDPVSIATCPFIPGLQAFAACVNHGYVLVQTQVSGLFFAVKANADCTAIATPEITGIVPCYSADAFDPVTGCYSPDPLPDRISVEEGFIKLDSISSAPRPQDCADDTHDGRMVVDSVNNRLYICTQSGWTAFDPAP